MYSFFLSNFFFFLLFCNSVLTVYYCILYLYMLWSLAYLCPNVRCCKNFKFHSKMVSTEHTKLSTSPVK